MPGPPIIFSLQNNATSINLNPIFEKQSKTEAEPVETPKTTSPNQTEISSESDSDPEINGKLQRISEKLARKPIPSEKSSAGKNPSKTHVPKIVEAAISRLEKIVSSKNSGLRKAIQNAPPDRFSKKPTLKAIQRRSWESGRGIHYFKQRLQAQLEYLASEGILPSQVLHKLFF